MTPTATYRLQLHAGFTFADAAAVAGYLAELGVSHVYCSPYLQAAAGSTHGYDVVDHRRVNVELGGDEGHARFCRALAEAGLGQVLDVVPNHMAITSENEWWRDVLENGPASRYASYFDVDWDPPESRLRNTVLLPILGDHYGRVLEAGEIALEFVDSWFRVAYFEHDLPVAPPSVDTVLLLAAGACDSDELAFLGAALGRLPVSTLTDRVSMRHRQREAGVLRALLARLCASEPATVAAIAEVVDRVNADPDALDGFLERQNYRLAHWRTAGRELDYRRFFDIDSLAALRMEDDDVFADTHALVLGWLDRGVLDGVRVDHPDGLRDPEGYFRRLRQAGPGTWLVAEKILEAGEHLRPGWSIDGTTGYDALELVTSVFVDPDGEKPLTDLYVELTGHDAPFAEIAYEAKHEIMRTSLAADVGRLTGLMLGVCERQRRYRDFTRHDLHDALREVLACFAVYRAYVPEDRAADGEEQALVAEAVAAAAARRPDIDADLLALLERVLTGRYNDQPDQVEVREVCARFQHLTGPVMAKGVEDTAFYRYHRLVALNEVGGDPGRFGRDVEEFHAECARLASDWPRTMTTLSTHDTKRSEDVRARLVLLSHDPDRWGAFARRWVEADNGDADADSDADADVDAPTRYLLLQTVIGAWPLERERAAAYALKAVKEAKVRTSWIARDEAYESAVANLVDRWYGDAGFCADVERFVMSIRDAGRTLSLAQKLVQLTMPGVPDVYQGCELWALALVDPDNRRPVDYEMRRQLLVSLGDAPGVEAIVARADEGLPKLWLVRQALHARRRIGDLGRYRSLPCGRRHLAFVRGDRLVTVVPRLALGGDPAVGGEVELPDGWWHNLLTGDDVSGGGPVPVADLLARFPVALLERRRAEGHS